MTTTSIITLFFGLTPILLCSVNAAFKLPKDYVTCKLNDPALSECIKNGIQSGIPLLSKGIINLGILPLDPMRIPALGINQGTGSVKINLSLKDAEISNFHTLIIDELKCDPKTYSINFTIHTQEPVKVESLYTARGSVLVMPINGNGTLKIAFDNFKANFYVTCKPVEKKGMTHLEIDKFSWDFTTSKMRQNYTNLFEGNKVMGDNMNVFLNENWAEVLTDFRPAVVEAFAAYMVTIPRQFFERIPLAKMFIV